MKRILLFTLFLIFSFNQAVSAAPTPKAEKPQSIARQWNEAMVQAIRWDYRRPTVAARNLFHLSLALYDTWALYTDDAQMYFINFRVKSSDVEKDRAVAMSYAAYRILEARFAHAPKQAEIHKMLDALMAAQGTRIS